MDIISFLLGIVIGIFAGFLPGIHPNTVASLLSTAPFDENSIAMIIIGMFPANLVASFIPAIFFGIPEAGTVVAALPGQRMTMAGKGLTALKTVLVSFLLGALFSFALFFPSLELFPFIHSLLQPYMKYIVLVLAAVLVLRSRKKTLAVAVFIAAGALGYFALNSGIYDPFMPLFSGLFAVGTLLTMRQTKVPEQKPEEPFRNILILYVMLGVLFGLFADLLPGISSPSQMAVFMGFAVPMNSLAYLSSISSISISEAMFSLSTHVSIDKSRIGTTAWLSEFIDIEQNIFILLALFLFSAAVAVMFLYFIRKKIASLAVLNSRPIAMVFLVYLFIVAVLLNGYMGIIILILSSALGWTTVKLGVERIQLMGAVIVPTLLLLFGIFI